MWHCWQLVSPPPVERFWAIARRGDQSELLIGSNGTWHAAHVDSRLPELVHLLTVGVAVGDDDIDVAEIADMAECHPAELRGVGDDDDPLRGLRGVPLHGCLGEEVGGDAGPG